MRTTSKRSKAPAAPRSFAPETLDRIFSEVCERVSNGTATTRDALLLRAIRTEDLKRAA